MTNHLVTSPGRLFSRIDHDGARLCRVALTCTGSPP
jgi:hypothetical protein